MNRQMTREQAIAFGETEQWKPLTMRERAEIGLSNEYLCIPFGVLQEAVEKSLGRPVYSHEFMDMAGLLAELRGEQHAPSLREVIGMLPADKTVVIVAPPKDEP